MDKKTYILEDNLELTNENFIIKKGTILHLNNTFNESDSDIPTILGVNFDKINGLYPIDKDEFQNMLDLSQVRALIPAFHTGECVKKNGISGKIGNPGKYDSMAKTFFYQVLFPHGATIEQEEDLSAC